MVNYYIGLTLTGIITGLVAGFIGGGAEILIVPLLTIFGLLNSFKTRIGTSLFMLLPPIGLFAVYKFYKEDKVDIFAALYMALIFTIFSYLSSIYSLKLDEDIIRKIFGGFTILAGFYIFFTSEKK